tara:strand:- start:2354 stop:3052 length:699 start_codon:yes stop_codon:yes gene_type:complete
MSSILLEPYREVTTEAILVDLEADAQKHIGLWVDMNNSQERKYVKDKAALGKALIKKLDRSRIDQSAAHKLMLDTEAETIRLRLEDIISPYTVLINLYADEQKVIRDKAKARQDAIDLAFEIERDYDYALLMDAQVMRDKADAIQAQADRDAIIATTAADLARKEIKRQLDAEVKAQASVVAARLADIENVSSVLRAAKEDLMLIEGVDEALAKSIVLSIRNNTIRKIYIKY